MGDLDKWTDQPGPGTLGPPIIVTVACAVVIVILFLSELFDYRSIHLESSLVVDSGRKERMNIELDITFRKIPCYSIV